MYGLYKNDSKFSSYKTINDLSKNFNPSEKEWQSFVAYISKDSIHLNNVSEKGKKEILNRIKAMMGRQLFQNEGLFEILNQNDEAIEKALDILK